MLKPTQIVTDTIAGTGAEVEAMLRYGHRPISFQDGQFGRVSQDTAADSRLAKNVRLENQLLVWTFEELGPL